MNVIFLVLTFILIIIVILMTGNLATAVLVISLLANFLFINSQFNQLHNATNSTDSTAPNKTVEHTDDSTTSKDNIYATLDQVTDPYGHLYEQHHVFDSSYSTAYPEVKNIVGHCSDTSYGIDSANAIMAQRRARDKKCSDGWATKTADYYKYHYGNELNDAERKIWWSLLDY